MPPPTTIHIPIGDKKQREIPLPIVDLALAERLLKGVPHSPAVSTFISHLSIAARQGHLCVTPELPHPKDLWPMVIEEDLDWDWVAEQVKTGAKELPEGLPIHRDGDRYYFRRYWEDETALIHHLQRILDSKPKCVIGSLNTDGLLPEQAQAVKNCGERMISIICGGPGTGKTYTVGQFLNQLPADFRIALAAPTGKAAANLQASVNRPDVQAKTLHSLLGITKGNFETRKIPADIIIVDECSMIDARLMQNLFAAVKTGCRLILLGDPHQLPPVEAGSLFGDLIEALPELTTTLKRCLRAESQEIIDYAEAINAGQTNLAFSDIKTFNVPDSTPDNQTSFRILSPLKKGPYGVDRINAHYLKQAMHRMRGNGPHTFPILIVGNDHRMELYNGELGVLVRHGPINDLQPKKGDYALFSERRVPALLLPRYDYAYCLSVHKSQGSEFDKVVLLIPPGAEHFGRKVLYTGATRAKKFLEVWSTEEVMKQIVTQNARRMSGLTFRLR